MSVNIRNQEQKEASDPQNSVWLLASAGTGKTKVLIDRVLKLILTGADPEKILCLSFTKAAANEIENRLQSTLLKWAAMDTPQLSRNVESLLPYSNVEIQPKNCLLLAQVISEKFKVYTIHAFCQDLINKFLFELKLKYNTCIINKVQSNAILNIAKKELLSLPNSEEFSQFKILLKYYSYTQISSIINKIFDKFFLLKQILHSANTGSYANNLKNIFSLHSKPEYDEILNSYLNNLPQINLAFVSNKDATNLDKEKIYLLERFLSNTLQEQKQTWLSLASFFLTDDINKKTRLFSSAFIQNNKEFHQNILQWQDLFLKTYINIELHNNYEINYAFFVIVKIIFSRFTQIKQEKGYIDYDDLIHHAQTLLSPNLEQEWTLYKLNNGFDHILIDEAQDTSKEQWHIIENLVQNLVLGNTAKNDKTIFVVGDEKQSIYSFQGANIEHFKKVQELFQNLITNVKQTYKVINLINCYRSSQVILDFVYDVLSFAKSKGKFEVQNIKLTSGKEPGDSYIKLMPLINQSANENLENAFYIAAQTLMQQTAKIIALKVFDILQKKVIAPSTKSTLKPEDIMILVQRRGRLSSNIISECKKLGINITSSGRIFLQDTIIIMDILSLAKFVLFPFDNFNLTCLLKSPFFGMKEKDLNELFFSDSEKKQILLSLLENSKVNQFQNTYKELCQVQNLYKQTNLFTFFYIAANCLEKCVRNMANNALELCELNLLDEFLNVVNNFKSSHEGSLQKFVQWFLENPIELNVKNQHSKSVKITTAHGSKGLEAPCVIIADANEVDTLSDDIIFDKDVILINRKVHSGKTHLINQQKKSLAYQEYLRLMYVAFTRCKDYLIIFGSGSEKKDILTWYNFADLAMKKESSNISSKIFEKLGIYSKVFIRANQFFNNFTQNSSKLTTDVEKAKIDAGVGELILKNKVEVRQHQGKTREMGIDSAQVTTQNLSYPKTKAEVGQQQGKTREMGIDSAQITTQNLLSPYSHNIQSKNAYISFSDSSLNNSLNDQKTFFGMFRSINLPDSKPYMLKTDEVSNLDSLKDGEKVHKLLEKLLNGAQIEDIYSDNLFLSLNTEKQNYIRQFLLSNLYKEILDSDQIYTERVLSYNNCPNQKTNSKSKILRIDLLCIKSNTAKIIDYKTDVKPCNNIKEIPSKYLNQILEYKAVVAKIYPTLNVEGYIFWLQNCSNLRVT